jgi:hypothetical protein
LYRPPPNVSPPKSPDDDAQQSTFWYWQWYFDSEDIIPPSNESHLVSSAWAPDGRRTRNTGKDESSKHADKKKDCEAVTIIPRIPSSHPSTAVKRAGRHGGRRFGSWQFNRFLVLDSLTSRYLEYSNALHGFLPSTRPPLQLEHEQTVQAAPGPYSSGRLAPLHQCRKNHRPAQEHGSMLSFSTIKQSWSCGRDHTQAGMPVPNEQVTSRNNADWTVAGGVSTTLEQLRYGSLITRNSCVIADLATKPAFELYRQLEQALKYKPAAVDRIRLFHRGRGRNTRSSTETAPITRRAGKF